jgi:GT2 family glycosyltransferase
MTTSAAIHGGHLAVLVCTRNRPDDLDRCLASIARSIPPGAQLIVVDQSDSVAAEQVARILGRYPEALHIESKRRGLSVARNQGIGSSDREYILCTDDDCEVDAAWASSWVKVLEGDPCIGIGFGRVTEPPGTLATLTPTFDPLDKPSLGRRELLIHGFGGIGIGANMVVRREAWSAAGGFDELLGAGSRFPGAEEADMAVRVARAGYRHARDSGPSVVHYGSRWDTEASELAKAYALGAGAMLAKMSRCGDAEAMLWTAAELIRRSQALVIRLLRRSRPFGFRHLSYFLRGMALSARYKVDRAKMVYRPT